MRLLITGAEGFIGSVLTHAAIAAGHEVWALSRGGRAACGIPLRWALGEALPRRVAVDIDCAIHLAHDFSGPAGARMTIAGTLALAAELAKAGVARQLYFSSYSAGPHAASVYGRTKFEIERGLSAVAGMVIVRPGLVIGDGGLFGRIRKWARILPVVPLPNGGMGEVPVIGIERLCAETLDLALSPALRAEANLFEPRLRRLREIVLEAAAEAGRTPLILALPSGLMLFALRIATACRLPLPVNADNLAGFLANQQAMHASSLLRN